MTNATAAQTAIVFEAGDVVWGRPVVEGKTLSRRKGIVLGLIGDCPEWVVVWWFGQGEATADNTTMMFRRELTKSGDIFDMGARQAEKLARLADAGYGRARFVRNLLARHAFRMRTLGAQFPVK